MPAQYTGITLTAGQGLLTNQGLQTPIALTNSVANYNSVTVVNQLEQITANAVTILGNADVTLGLLTLGNATMPAATNAIPYNYANTVAVAYPTGLTGYVTDRANYFLGNGDLTKFAQIIYASQNYIQQSTAYINAANNANLNDPTFNFPGENNLITANFSDFATDLKSFGQDFARLGSVINLKNINNIGSPVTVLQNLAANGGLTNGVIQALLRQGLSAETINKLSDINYPVTANDNLTIYNALLTVTGNDLTQALTVLNCQTLGFATLADTLNPAKLFPNSYTTITVRVAGNLINVYSPTPPNTINPLLPNLGTRLTAVIPADQAQAWYALERDFNAVKGLDHMTTQSAGLLIETLETVTDLPLIATFDQFVPASTQLYWNSEFGMGTGPGNTITAYDILGTAVGSPETVELTAAVANLAVFDFGNLSTVYSYMANTLAGDYGNVLGNITLPYDATVYPNANVAFTQSLIPNAQANLTSIVATDTQANTNLWTSWQTISYQLYRENDFLSISGLLEANALLSNSTTSTLSLINSLHNFGLDIGANGYSNLFTTLANTQTIYGQAVVASLREGRNITAIDATNVRLSSALNPSFLP